MEIATVRNTYDIDFRALAEAQKPGAGKNLSCNVYLALYNPSHSLPTDRNYDHADYDTF